MWESMEKLEFMPAIKDQPHGVEFARKQESQARAGDTQDRTLGASCLQEESQNSGGQETPS